MPIFWSGGEFFAFNVILFFSRHLIFPNLRGILVKNMERKSSFMFKLQHNEYYVLSLLTIEQGYIMSIMCLGRRRAAFFISADASVPCSGGVHSRSR